MSGLCSAKAVANYFLDLAERDGETLNPMQIQKLVYLAHGWHLGLWGSPLIRESVEAWTWGPVIADLYHEFKQWGSGPIGGQATELRVFKDKSFQFVAPSIDEECSEADSVKALLERVWEVYRRFTAIQLSKMTHQPDTPWSKTRDAHPGKRNVSIPDEVIQDHFTARAQQNVAGND